MSDSTAVAIVILAIVIIVIGAPFALNQYNEMRQQEELQKEIQEVKIRMAATTTTPTTMATPVSTPTTPAPAVKNGIFGVWWCSPNVRQVLSSPGGVHCYQFYENKILYQAASRGVADPTLSWWTNNQGQYETSEPTFNYKGNILEDTWGNIYQWCPYQDQNLCLSWTK